MPRRYYWMKLKQDFFDSIRIKRLRKIAGGDTLTIIYLKLLLVTMDNDGIVEYEGIEKSIAEELALLIDENPEDVGMCLTYLKSVGLVEMLSENVMLFPEAVENVGSESASAKRMRDLRGKVPALKSGGASHCDGEIEKDKEKEIDNTLCDSILDYLNEKAGFHYRKVDSNRKHIRARIKEGYKKEDFISVIDKKCAEWKGTRMEGYLRPGTLFNSEKFDGYLNQPVTKQKDMPSYAQQNGGELVSEMDKYLRGEK